jgi:hypothetical protein
MSTQHTPGPWTHGPLAGGHQAEVYSEPTGRTVALAYDADNGDARLIAAAPELLALVRALHDYWPDDPDGEVNGADLVDFVSAWIGDAADALAKVTP